MRMIKSFRLFESGKDKLEGRIAEIVSIYEDAKSIEYILEEGNYDYEWKISTEHNSYKINDNIPTVIRNYSYPADGAIFHHDFLKPVIIRINVLGIDGIDFSQVNFKTVKQVKDDMLRFKTLLEEHLDYLPEGAITLYDAGWIGNYKINIKIP